MTTGVSAALRERKAVDFGADGTDGAPPIRGRPSDLRFLYLPSNRLAGLPAALGRLAKLEYLDASNNPLSGPLPDFLTEMPQLKFEFVNTQLCIPDEPAFREWLRGQSRQIYVYREGKLVPLDPETSIRWHLANSMCKYPGE